MSTQHDFRDQEPVWVRYAEYIGNGSDKYYEVRIDMDDMGDFVLTKRWGARPDAGAGQIKVQSFQSLNGAQQSGLSMFAEKVRKGYRETDRPYGASRRVIRVMDDYPEDED